MPTYRYKCPNGHELEEFQSINASVSRPCPECSNSESIAAISATSGTALLDDDVFDGIVWMQRQIGGGGGVIWKGGSPTPRFSRRR